MNVPVTAELPEKLFNQAQHFIQEGWATDLNELITAALQRYPDTHNSELMDYAGMLENYLQQK
jgi:hypothetical protein